MTTDKKLELNKKRVQMQFAALELAQYASYAEIIGAIGFNRSPIRKWCDEVFKLNNEIGAIELETAEVEDLLPFTPAWIEKNKEALEKYFTQKDEPSKVE